MQISKLDYARALLPICTEKRGDPAGWIVRCETCVDLGDRFVELMADSEIVRETSISHALTLYHSSTTNPKRHPVGVDATVPIVTPYDPGFVLNGVHEVGVD